MKTIAKGFIELVNYLEIAKFDDPDEDWGAREVVVSCLLNSSTEERALLCGVASERAAELRAQGCPENVIEFYDRFVERVKGQYY